jgi:alanine dehydrogenase
MIVGLLKEIKPQERRVGLTPDGVRALVRAGHTVLVERQAGVGSGFPDSEYLEAGAQILDREAVCAEAGLLVKVKEPLPEEYPLLRPGQILFTYLHLAPAPELAAALLRQDVIAIAYETIEEAGGHLPLLTPMSQVAGRMSIQVGAQFLEWFYGGAGVLLSGVPGVAPAHVAVIGAGTVGQNAIAMAVGLGARVTALDTSLPRLTALDERYQGRVTTLASTPETVARVLPTADLVIGAVLVPGSRAPHVVTEQMVKTMRPGSVIVDVAIDQGGCVETCDHPTTHADPVYIRHQVVHYAVANMPGAVPRTSTLALTNVTLPFVLRIASMSPRELARDPVLASGINVFRGNITHRQVAQSLNLPYRPLAQVV